MQQVIEPISFGELICASLHLPIIMAAFPPTTFHSQQPDVLRINNL